MTSADKNDLFSLHKYFIWADRMRVHFEQILQNPKNPSFDIEANLYMSYWYGGMYVVIEGYLELQLSDTKIDELLKSQNVGLLKRYRNGVFHFQKNYNDDRFSDFMKSKNSVPWVRELRQEFSRFFLASFPPTPTTTKTI